MRIMLKSDIAAGISIAGILLPSAVAYAAIAALPPQQAIIASIVGMLVYAALGGSRFAVVAPTSSSAAILAAGLAALNWPAALREAAAEAAVILAGLFFVAARLARLGGLANFISRPVLRGFAFGIGVTIVARQLPSVLGVAVAATDPFRVLLGLALKFGAWNWVSAALGAAALGAVVLLRRWRAIPGAVLVLAAGVAFGAFGDPGRFHVALVGAIAAGGWHLAWPALHFSQWTSVAQFGLPLMLILFAESWGAMRGLALKHGDSIVVGRELVALGAANLAAGLAQGMPVGAGMSQSSASEAAGAQSRWAGVVAALVMAALLGFGRSAMALLPLPVLAAVVISTLLRTLDPRPLLRLWTLRRDELVASCAALAVMGLGVLDGMLVAVALSVFALLRRLAGASVAELGHLPDSHDFIDSKHNEQAVLEPGIIVLRPGEPLFFANAERVLSEVAARAQPVVILSLEESDDLDSTALDVLVETAQRLKTRGIKLLLARVKDNVRDGLKRAGGEDLASASFWSVADAFEHARRLTAEEPECPPPPVTIS